VETQLLSINFIFSVCALHLFVQPVAIERRFYFLLMCSSELKSDL